MNYLKYLFFVLLISNCSNNKIEIKNTFAVKNSNVGKLVAVGTDTIFIGDRVTPKPLSSQIYLNNNILKYILLDENVLYFFDFKSGKFDHKIKINSSYEEGCGILNNYSGFYYHSKDSIFIYNYALKKLFLVDSDSKIKKSWETKSHIVKYPVDAEALSSSPILLIDSFAVLSGSGLGQPDDATYKNKPVSCAINLKSNQLSYFAGYPQQYRKGNFGGVYFNEIFHAKANNKIVYSFPADHYLYLYNVNTWNYDTIYAGSQYIETIHSSDMSALDLFFDKNNRIKYYTQQPSYGNILFDQKEKIYYRFAYHPLKNWTPDKITFQKPFSIIVLNEKGSILLETKIFDNPKQYYLQNTHIVPDKGLIIQKKSKNENIIIFEEYKIETDN